MVSAASTTCLAEPPKLTPTAAICSPITAISAVPISSAETSFAPRNSISQSLITRQFHHRDTENTKENNREWTRRLNPSTADVRRFDFRVSLRQLVKEHTRE